MRMAAYAHGRQRELECGAFGQRQERHRVLFEDGRVEPPPALVEPIEAFAEADHALPDREAKGEPHADRTAIRTKPGDAAGLDPIGRRPDLLGDRACRFCRYEFPQDT
jgi:hypothetical protein